MSYRYVGSELELFSAATNWKRYFATALAPFIAGRVLEVGAGIGSNTPYLTTDKVQRWTSLEPDPDLAARIPSGEVVTGTLDRLDPAVRFDTILYIDVLEHIAADGEELAKAARHLAPSGRLVVLAPAHQFLFSPFDEAVGHHRRYSAASLRRLTPPGCRLRKSLMLDSVGFFASLANRLLLSARQPSPGQIAFWDKALVPLSRIADRCTFHAFGKSVVTVWSRSA